MARKPKPMRGTRREGGRMDPEALDAQLLVRGLGSTDLAKLTGFDKDTIANARRGNRVRRATVLKIVDVLAKIPIRPGVAALVGVAVPPPQPTKKTKPKTRRAA